MTKPGPDPTDVLIGARVRTWRRVVEMSITQLAAALGVTWQQTRRYETGQTRMHASTLVRIAAALGTSVGELVDDAVAGARDPVRSVALDPEAKKLLRAYARIPDADVREHLLGVVTALAQETDKRKWARLGRSSATARRKARSR